MVGDCGETRGAVWCCPPPLSNQGAFPDECRGSHPHLNSTRAGYSGEGLLGQEAGLFSRDLELSTGELINKVQIKASE
jgi:hypothetical protein